MAMEAEAMPGGATPPSPLQPPAASPLHPPAASPLPARPLPSPPPVASPLPARPLPSPPPVASPLHRPLPSPPPAASPLHQFTPPVGGITSLPSTTTGQGAQAAGDLEHGQGGQASGEVHRPGPSTKKKRKKDLLVPQAAGEVGGEPHAAGELDGELQKMPGEIQPKKSRKKKVLTHVLEEAGYTKDSNFTLPDFMKSSKCGNTSMPLTAMEQGDQASGDLKQDGVCSIDVEKQTVGAVRVVPSSEKKQKKRSGNARVVPQAASEVGGELHTAGELGGELRNSGEVRGKQQMPGKVHDEVQLKKSRKKVTTAHSKEISPTAGSKRPFSEASGSLRARKAAKIINAKVVTTQLENKSKTARRNMPPIVSRSPIVNMMARQKAQLSARSPNSTKSPSLHDLSPGPAHGIPSSSHDVLHAATNGSKRRPRKLTSVIWKDAEPVYIDGFLMEGRCKYCSSVFPASKVSGTTTLARHLKVCEAKSSMDVVIQQIRTSDEIDPDWRFNQEASRTELVNLIVLHGLPFTFVEYDGFRKFCASLNPWFKSVNRVTIQQDCIGTYNQFKNIYESSFIDCKHRVSLTGDMWTSNQKLGYLCITCHWIDEKWRVRHRIIRFCLVETPHDSWNMFDVVLKSLRDWNIEDKIFSFTMDNAEVNTKMIGHLRSNLVDRGLIHHEGKLLHIRCAAHVLNLIVQDGLKAMESAVDNVRDSVKYIRSSQTRKDQFAKMVTQAGVKCKRQPSLDVSTRWNSTFDMLESTLPFRKAFRTLEEQDPSYTFGPSPEEWTMVEDICKLLKTFCHATNAISGSNYPTSNLYFLEIWSVKLILDEQAKSGNATIKIMVKEMKTKFHKYFMESYLTNSIPVILDPRFKLEHVEFRLKKYFVGADVEKPINEVRTAIKSLFREYAEEFEDNVLSQNEEEQNEEEVLLADSALFDWDEHVKLKKAKSRSELQRYLEDDFHPRTQDFDILKWWDVNSANYPVLGRIARDVLAVPASTVASESAFSTCGRVVTDHRSSLGAETVEALMCYGDWIKPRS